ncbi:D-sedoheptulose-7-phosphate isomerase [Oceanospirillum sediminis]|uniref:Phosphoheptose isomerase n=1 Tax=Oceanospirillum sediminis TaxID=2760088 RepID=A0A839IN39_9GAMM|nr:D-sedoheptulose 7-phosphate isomerase [Oceanospirillum sediminis]MBB1485706.1 D-sedoheptulose 7-phosphate isomerase [Oceanospirillum sediminis]
MSFLNTLQRHQDTINQLSQFESVVSEMADRVEVCIRNGGKVLFMGNGGSAADSQHLAAEFVVRYKKERPTMAAIALTTDTSILTAHSNDYSFDTVFSRQIQALTREGDIVIGLSTSGNSANVIDAIKEAKQLGCHTYAWTGESGGQLLEIADATLRMPSSETARIQEAHMLIGHWLCEEMDERFS